MKGELFVGSRPTIDKSALTGFTAVTLTITAKAKSVVTIFMGMNGQAIIFTLSVLTRGKAVMVMLA